MPSFSLQSLLVIVAVSGTNLALLQWIRGRPAGLARVRSRLASAPGLIPTLVVVMLVVVWLAIFVVYRFPITGDVALFFVPQADAVLAGGLPHTDFESSYMPLFVFLLAGVRALSRSLYAIPILFLACTALSAVLLDRLLRGMEVAASTALPLAFLSGGFWLLAIGYQQDDVLLLVLVLGTLLLLQRGQDLAAGGLVTLGFFLTKPTFGISLLVALLFARRRGRLIAGAAVVGVPIALWLLAVGWDPSRVAVGEVGRLVPPSFTATLVSASGVDVRDATLYTLLLLGSALIVVVGLVALRAVARELNGRVLSAAFVAAWLLFCLSSPKSLTSYRLLVLPLLPAILVPALGRMRYAVLFAVYSTSAGIQYMLWEDWHGGLGYRAMWTSGGASQIAAVLLVSLDLTILLSELVWLRECFRVVKTAAEPVRPGRH